MSKHENKMSQTGFFNNITRTMTKQGEMEFCLKPANGDMAFTVKNLHPERTLRLAFSYANFPKKEVSLPATKEITFFLPKGRFVNFEWRLEN